MVGNVKVKWKDSEIQNCRKKNDKKKKKTNLHYQVENENPSSKHSIAGFSSG